MRTKASQRVSTDRRASFGIVARDSLRPAAKLTWQMGDTATACPGGGNKCFWHYN